MRCGYNYIYFLRLLGGFNELIFLLIIQNSVWYLMILIYTLLNKYCDCVLEMFLVGLGIEGVMGNAGKGR